MIFLYFYLIVFSLVGYGLIISRYLNINVSNFGIYGLLGITFFAIISYSTSLFLKHGVIFNSLVIILGILILVTNLGKIKKKKEEFIYLLLIFSLLLLFIAVGKNHDDFPYYHFPYIELLTDLPHPLGLGLLNGGFRSPSSLFFISSIFFLPITEIYLFHITPALILGFTNIILLKNIFSKELFEKRRLISFLSILTLAFINIFFYRLAEHGTDRSGMIISLITIIYLIQIIDFKEININQFQINESLIKILIILVCFTATIKPYYLINFSIFLIFLFFEQTRKIVFKLFFSRVFYFCLALILFTLFFTFINSGCLIFPMTFTCFDNLPWSLNKDLINKTKLWFELWSKAGATPNFIAENRLEYVSEFNWLSTWMKYYFFNKVSDFLLGILFLSLVIFFIFFKKNISQNLNQNNIVPVYILVLLLFFEWFINHPTLRYGGYHLIALLIFIPVGIRLAKLKIDYRQFLARSLIILSITLIIFSGRNLSRLDKEKSLYGFNPLKDLNYKFIGGNEEFYYRYNTRIKENSKNFRTISFLGKKILIIKKD